MYKSTIIIANIMYKGEFLTMAIQETNTVHALDTNEFELPIGFKDKDGNFVKTVTLKEMTGLVDEAIADVKIRNNPAKMVSEALFGVIEKFGNGKSPTKDAVRNLTTFDRDYLLLMNHKVSLGDDIEWEEQCVRCGGKFDANINIDNIPTKFMTEDEPKEYEIELPVGVKDAEGKVYKKIKVTLPDGVVQEKIVPMLQENPVKAITQMLTLITEDIQGLSHWNFKTFQEMTKKDRNFIANELKKVDAGPNLNPMVSCPSCGHTYSSQIPPMKLLGE